MIGPFDVVGKRRGSLVCKVSGPVRKARHRRIDIPMRVPDATIDRLFADCDPAPKHVPVAGDSRLDGLLASASDGVVAFASENWDVIQEFVSLLTDNGIPHSMRSASELVIEDKALCGRCAAIPVDERIPDDGFMCGFLSPMIDSGRVPGCPDWAVESTGGRVIVAKDRYGNPMISPMCAHLHPFELLCVPKDAGKAGGVPQEFMFAAAESVFASSLDLSGYSVDRIWSDGCCCMLRASSGGSSTDLVVTSDISEAVMSQLKCHPVPAGALVVALSKGIRVAPYSKITPFHGVKGLDWSCTEKLFSDPASSGLELSAPIRAETERALAIIWAAGPGSTEV